MAQLYKDYFDIDENYYAAVTADLIKQGKVSWKKFYPHETFVKLLETTYRVLNGQENRSIWVEGAYGTGKSHAALTVKSLLEAPEADVREYFQDFGLSTDLMDKYLSLQRSNNHILVVHRIGSSDIHTDMDLIMAVQESILAALKEHGIENQGEASMREAFLDWVEKPGCKDFFASMIQNPKYILDFSGMTADDIIGKLKNSTYEEVAPLMAKVMAVLKDNALYGLFTNTNQMAGWIQNIIDTNHLSSILFVWDEFSEFFINHPTGLTGFQTLIEISASHPFYFMIVAHQSEGLFKNAKDTAKKILDRFVPPVKIELPENMAFKLMAQAMKPTDDVTLRGEWESDKADLNDSLVDARHYIVEKSAKQSGLGKKTHLSDKELSAIVPMHPYAALILKHIATVFNSNQRSMFDFIISNDMTDAKGFKWFINHFGSLDDQNLLTIDLLWDFFCGKQKLGLNDGVRRILDCYNTMKVDKLTEDEKRVVKTILLFQAISLHVASNELLAPNGSNLEMAFSGTDWPKGKAQNIASALVKKGLIFEKSLGGNQKEYVVANGGAQDDMKKYIEEAERFTVTERMITNGNLLEAITVPAAVKGRYLVNGYGTGGNSFTKVFNVMKGAIAPNHFKVMTTFAILDEEDQALEQKIHEKILDMGENCVIVRTLTPMGRDLRNQYRDNLALNQYNHQKDKGQEKHFENQANNVLETWKNKIAAGAFMVYTTENPNGQRMANLDDLQQFFIQWDYKTYHDGVDQYELTDTLYGPYQLGQGALCGITEKLNSAYKGTSKKNFEIALRGAWGVPKYWEKPENRNLSIVKIKNTVDDIIDKGFHSQAGRVSMQTIWDALTEAPYGLMVNSVAALVLGFVLKEYVNSQYFWSNGSITETMTVAHMKDMISNVMTGRMKEKSAKVEYIVSMTPEVRTFLDVTTRVFGMQGRQFGSVEEAASRLCIKVKEFSFPLWTVKYVLDDTPISSDKALVERIIDNYSGIFNGANAKNGDASRLAEEIGKTLMQYPALEQDLALLCKSEKTLEGMQKYVFTFQDGILPKLAQEICDGGKYMQRIKAGFSAGEANWLWSQGTAEKIISDVILEYQIIAESKKCLVVASSFDGVIKGWDAKVKQIKMPCAELKMKVGALGDFLQLLLPLSQTHAIQDKETFYHLLSSEGESFKELYSNQFPYFKAVVSGFVDGLDEEGLQKLYLELPTGQFGKSSQEYFQMIDDRVKAMMQNEIRTKLAKLWMEKTGSKSPRDWSYEHLTPILCLFDDEERTKAKKYLPLIGRANALPTEVKEAIEYLEKADFYDRMKNRDYMNQRFMDLVVGDYSILLKDPDAIRKALAQEVTSQAYDWWNDVTTKNQIKKMYQREYKLCGQVQAEQVFEAMDADQLREYLRYKLTDPDFGMQILKGRK